MVITAGLFRVLQQDHEMTNHTMLCIVYALDLKNNVNEIASERTLAYLYFTK